MALRGLSLREVNIWRTVVLPLVVASAALAVAIVGAVIVGTGGGTDTINLFVDSTVSGNSQQFLGGLIGASALFALAAGMASAVNPCGFAMLPAYLGLYLGADLKEGEQLNPAKNVGRALLVGGAVSAGFILLFGVVGAIVGVSASFVSDVLPGLDWSSGLGWSWWELGWWGEVNCTPASPPGRQAIWGTPTRSASKDTSCSA